MSSMNRVANTFVAWGAFDLSKPRVRLLLAEITQIGLLERQINIPVWDRITDKTTAGIKRIFLALVRLAFLYPVALAKLLRTSRRSDILLPYPAVPDIFIVWPFAKVRGQAIIFDAFLPLHDTIVRDRQLLSERRMSAKLLWFFERAALRLADVIVVDTDQHGDFFSNEFGINRSKFVTILVGAEEIFHRYETPNQDIYKRYNLPTDLPLILFYGQLIPLHGIEVILDAVSRTQDGAFHWVLVGSGQNEPLLREFFSSVRPNATWLPWVNYTDLPSLISEAAFALGIFGTSEKAARVLPNKLFQVLAVGKPIITRTSPAAEQLAMRFPDLVITIPAGNGQALAEMVVDTLQAKPSVRRLSETELEHLSPRKGVKYLIDCLSDQGRSEINQPRRRKARFD